MFRKAGGCAQLQQLGVLLASDPHGSIVGRAGALRIGRVSRHQRAALEAEQLRCGKALAGLLHVLLGGMEHVERSAAVARGEPEIRQQHVEVREAEPGA